MGGRKTAARRDAVPGPVARGVEGQVGSSGLRRDYLCRPTVGKRHKFTALIEVEDEPVPLHVPPSKCPVHGAQGRRAKAAEWRRAVRAAEAADKRPPAKPKGLSLDPLPSASATRRRRRDDYGRELPARRTPSARSAEARNPWHVAADWVEMYALVLWQPLHEQLLAAEAAEHARRAATTDAERTLDGRPQVLLLDDTPVNSKAAFDGRATLRSRRRRLLRGAPRPGHARRPAAPAELADAAIADVGGQR